MSKSLPFVFLLASLYFLSCAHLGYELRKKPSEAEQEELRALKEDLVRTTYLLLALDPERDRETFEGHRREFDLLLGRYFELTGEPFESDYHLIRSGSATVILPFIIEDTSGVPGTTPVPGRSRRLWEDIGGEFHGEIIDLHIYSDSAGEPARLHILFQDSIISADLLNDTFAIDRKFDVPSPENRRIMSIIPAGFFLTGDPAGYHRHPPFITGRSGIPVFNTEDQSDSTDTSATELDSVSTTGAKTNAVPGKPFFQLTQAGQTMVQSMRTLNRGDRLIFLDDTGFLLLADALASETIWRSSRPWGHRIFFVGEDTVAVVNRDEKSFVLFAVKSDEPVLLGQSIPFDSYISAITPARRNGVSGLALALRYEFPDGSIRSRLQFIPGGMLHFTLPVIFDIPRLPVYESVLTIVKSKDNYSIPDPAFRMLQPIVFHNVYETLFTMTESVPRPLLALAAVPDSTYLGWTIQLRPDVLFSDGTPLDAESVSLALAAAQKKCLTESCPYAWLWEPIEPNRGVHGSSAADAPGVYPIESTTLYIRLHYPVPNLPEYLSHPCFHIARNADGSSWPSGTGPFRIASTGKGVSPDIVKTVRNEIYRHGMPPLKELHFILNHPDVVEFISGRRNVAASVRNRKDVEFFRELPRYRVVEFPGEVLYFFALNPMSAALTDPDSRKRIVALMDRAVFANIVNEAEGVPAFQITGSLPGNPEISSPERNVRITQPLRIYYYSNDPAAAQIAERLGALLSQAGIPYRRPEGLSTRAMTSIRSGGRYEVLVDSFESRFNSPLLALRELLSRGYRIESNPVDGEDGSGNPVDTAARLERELIGRMNIIPLLRVRNYAVIPYDLINPALEPGQFLDLSGAWFPRSNYDKWDIQPE